MKIYLKAKHWQLFLLFFVLPFILQMVITIYIVVTQELENIFSLLKVFPFFIAFYILMYNGWFWSIGSGLSNRLPDSVKMNKKLFIASLSYPAVYIFILMGVGYFFINEVLVSDEPDPSVFLYFLFLIPFHLLSMVCSIHSMYFVAKTIKAVELQKDVSFSDFAAEFFLIWFFPIGIWMLQPRLNKLVSN